MKPTRRKTIANVASKLSHSVGSGFLQTRSSEWVNIDFVTMVSRQENMIIARTERTEIAVLAIADAPFVLKLVNSTAWLRYIGDRNIHDIKAAEEYLRTGLLKHYGEQGYGYYVVRQKDGNSIGICGFLKKPHLDNEDFGFAFLPEYVRRGYGFESGLATLKYGVQQFQFRELDAETSSKNLASIRLLEKLGFRNLGPVINPAVVNQDTRLYRWQKGIGG